MGNSSSSGRGHHDETIDYGSLSPQGVYTGPRDWNQDVVTQLICERRLAPFYRPLEDYDENWDDDQILAARKELPTSDLDSHETVTRTEISAHSHAHAKANKRVGSLKEPSKPEAAVYRGAVECPICFLSLFAESSRSQQQSPAPSYPTHKRRQKSFGADNPEVVTTDQIRPDWEAKLAAVRAAVARRANRRIIMRQVGDRLIPVGVTSGRVHALSPEEARAEGIDNGGNRRTRRRQQSPNQNFEQIIGLGGQDLEEVRIPLLKEPLCPD
ncbi:hypothetical protein C0992_012155 [Termitomyces sp. T32_za158]|nr:hypothetical protein C0992_012155 [Termitomyces sp. T32_za158]